MRTFNFATSSRYSYPLEDVFAFFAEAEHLEMITPTWLEFRVSSDTPVIMGRGTQIDYRLRVRRVPIRWRSRITVWEPPYRFVDEQIRGPYRRWVHTHTFRPLEDATLVEDAVTYAVPGGSMINRLVVRPELKRIFDYRSVALEGIFHDSASRALRNPVLAGRS